MLSQIYVWSYFLWTVRIWHFSEPWRWQCRLHGHALCAAIWNTVWNHNFLESTNYLLSQVKFGNHDLSWLITKNHDGKWNIFHDLWRSNFTKIIKNVSFDMMTFHDIWWFLVTFDDYWWFFMIKSGDLSWLNIIYHNWSWPITIQFGDGKLAMLYLHIKQIAQCAQWFLIRVPKIVQRNHPPALSGMPLCNLINWSPIIQIKYRKT